MTGLEIAALVAMVAGAGMQYKATQDARSRQDASIRESLARQRELQQQAEQKAMSTARDYGTEDRRAEQTQIADQITTNYGQQWYGVSSPTKRYSGS